MGSLCFKSTAACGLSGRPEAGYGCVGLEEGCSPLPPPLAAAAGGERTRARCGPHSASLLPPPLPAAHSRRCSAAMASRKRTLLKVLAAGAWLTSTAALRACGLALQRALLRTPLEPASLRQIPTSLRRSSSWGTQGEAWRPGLAGRGGWGLFLAANGSLHEEAKRSRALTCLYRII